MKKRMSAKEIYDILLKRYGEAKCELNYSNNFELLVAVILSAQCTDKRVNEVTKNLFKKYNTPKQFAKLSQTELEKEIYSCGFYHNKAKNIISASKQIIKEFDGKLPNTQQELETLAGVGRKTANVVYSLAFKGDAIAVDTHVLRTSNRLRLCDTQNPIKCEQQLTKQFDKEVWTNLHFMLVMFGRYKCKAINPICEDCEFKSFCKYYTEKYNIK